MRKNEKGFTLVELIVVIAIVAILAAVGIVGYTQFIKNARDTKAQSELDQVVNVMYADALVDGIRIDGTKIVDTGGVLVVEAATGKLTFVIHKVVEDGEDGEEGEVVKNVLTADLFQNLMNIYAEGLEGTFTLDSNVLKYKVGGGNGEVIVSTVEKSTDDNDVAKLPFTANPGEGGVFVNPNNNDD